jgi:hypothetical protein
MRSVALARQDRYIDGPLSSARSYRRTGITSPEHALIGSSRRGRGAMEDEMRAEIQKLVEEIKQSVGLLRRHL